MINWFKNIFPIVCLCLFRIAANAQTDTNQVVLKRLNSKAQKQKPYVILISADGFRYDYAEKYQTSHLLDLASGGVKATSLMPVFPAITFPSHYTLVTGLYPSHHGLVSNRFYDPQQQRIYYSKSSTNAEAIWYGGTPIWTLAEQQGMLSACFYWVGSEIASNGIRPTYYYHYNQKISIHDRIQDVHNWLMLPSEKRPHIITFYLPEVDQISHKKGPDAPETVKAIRFIDSAVYELTRSVAATGLKVNFIFLSDHGMTTIPTDRPLATPAALDTNKFIITSGEGLLVNVYAKKGHEKDVMPAYQQLLNDTHGEYAVYLKSNMPDSLHYGTKDDRLGHIGDIVLMANYPNIFKLNSLYVDPGAHGYEAHDIKDMQSTFYAWGPNFRRLNIPTFNNVDVYPIIAKILGLKIMDKIDGSDAVANKIVKP